MHVGVVKYFPLGILVDRVFKLSVPCKYRLCRVYSDRIGFVEAYVALALCMDVRDSAQSPSREPHLSLPFAFPLLSDKQTSVQYIYTNVNGEGIAIIAWAFQSCPRNLLLSTRISNRLSDDPTIRALGKAGSECIISSTMMR